MTISAYVGLPGSGKSYSVMKYVVVPQLKKGRTVFSNIPMNAEWVEKSGYQDQVIPFDVQDIKDNDEWFQQVFKAGSVIVLDEAYHLWGAGLRVNKMVPGHKSFLAEHRHMVGENGIATEIIIVCQDLSQIGNFVRQLIETTYRSTKMSKAGMSNRFRFDVYHGPVTGVTPPSNQRVRSKIVKYDPEVFQVYKSQTKSETDEHGDEEISDNRFNIWTGGAIYAIFGSMILFAVLGFWSLSSFFGTDEEKLEMASAPVQVTSEVKTQSVVPSPTPQKKNNGRDYLEDAQLTIVSNQGVRRFDYLIRVQFEHSYADLTANDLRRIGYQTIQVTQCMARLVGHDEDRIVMCEQPEDTETPEETQTESIFPIGS